MKLHISISGISQTLFHGTGLFQLHKILKRNSFKLTSSLPTSLEDAKKPSDRHIYYMSTTRHLLNGFFGNRPSTGYSILTLDGKKLSNLYKGKPIVYGRSNRKYPVSLDNLKSMESEDRIFSTRPLIKDFKKYIKEVSILRPSIESDRDILETALDVIKLLKEYGIPYYIYSNGKDFLSQNKRKAINKQFYKELLKYKEELPEKRKRNSNKLNLNKKDYKKYRKDNISETKALLELYFAKTLAGLSKPAVRYLHSELLSNTEKENIRTLEHILSNNSYTDLKSTTKLNNLVVRHGGIKQFIEHLIQHYRKLARNTS